MQESVVPVSGRTQPARYQFPTFRLGSVLPQMSRKLLCKTSPDPIKFWLTVRFWPNGSGPEASQCARIIRPASGQRHPADPERMRIESGKFTGIVFSDCKTPSYLLTFSGCNYTRGLNCLPPTTPRRFRAILHTVNLLFVLSFFDSTVRL